MRRVTQVVTALLLSAVGVAAAQELPDTSLLSNRDLPVDMRIVPKTLTDAEDAVRAGNALGSRGNPIRCFTPLGLRQYLERLRCVTGSVPSFARVGLDGLGPYGTALDAYRLKCDGSTQEWLVYLDMTHESYVERRPIAGFTIVPPSEDGRSENDDAGEQATPADDAPRRN